MATAAAIYLRISDDQDGTQTATERQREDCIAFVQRKGWEVAGIFEDIDISAYKDVKRPAFDDMLDAVADGRVHTIVAWKMDRLTRKLRDLVRLDDHCDRYGATIATVADAVDTSTAAGKFVSELLVAQAKMESGNTSLRVRRAIAQAAAEGKPALSRTRAYGYDRRMEHVIPEEAAVIRECVQRALDREPLVAIARDLNQRGIRTSAGGEWRVRTLQRVITNACVSGQREYEGKLTPGRWEPIITPEELKRVRAVTAARTKRGRPSTAPLGGLVRCGLCGGSLVQWIQAKKSRRYRCQRLPGEKNCGRIVVAAEPLEAAVYEAVLHVLEGAHLPVEKDDSATNAVIAIEADIAALANDYYVEKLITKAEFVAARQALQDRLQAARAALARVPAHRRPVTTLTREEWEGLDVATRRGIVAQVLDHVAVGPAPQLGRVPFDTSRLAFVWRE